MNEDDIGSLILEDYLRIRTMIINHIEKTRSELTGTELEWRHELEKIDKKWKQIISKFKGMEYWKDKPML
jgi:hypothetical protein